MLHLAGESNER